MDLFRGFIAPAAVTLPQQLSPFIYRYEPPVLKAGSEHSKDPSIIILTTWMSASPLHITKYLVGYQTYYPGSLVLLIRSSPSDMILPSKGAQKRGIVPAAEAILSHLDLGSDRRDSTNPEILLHIFSNGGCYQACNLIRTYQQISSNAFPQFVTIFDSCPGRATVVRSIRALSAPLPSNPAFRALPLLLIYIVVLSYWIIHVPFGITDPIEHLRRSLYDSVLMASEKRRCYIYSEADQMVDFNDVESHAQEAVRRGLVVDTEKFEGSAHCAHIRVGGGLRYWDIVRKTWRQE